MSDQAIVLSKDPIEEMLLESIQSNMEIHDSLELGSEERFDVGRDISMLWEDYSRYVGLRDARHNDCRNFAADVVSRVALGVIELTIFRGCLNFEKTGYFASSTVRNWLSDRATKGALRKLTFHK